MNSPFPAAWRGTSLALALLGAICFHLHAAETPPPAVKQGAELLKTDIMGVFAHPDDETGMAATLAHYALGQSAIVANVYCTRGEGGGNMVGTHWGAALGILREAELRDCLRTIGVRYCYFLDRLDWAYTESVMATLEKWNKEETLEGLVRLVRVLRPDVMVTMNPAPSAGQHGHHQAAGVLATEAFAAAADPKRFPLQLSKEGLSVWQARKLFYGGGNTGIVTTIDVTQALPGGATAAQTAGRALSNHRSQAFGNFVDSPWLQRPQKFTLVKSFVPAADGATDLLEGVKAESLAPLAFEQAKHPAVRLEFAPRPAVANYQRWAKEQGIEHVAMQFSPDLPVIAAERNSVTLRLWNDGPAVVQSRVQLSLPEGWSVEPKQVEVAVPSGESKAIQVSVVPPPRARNDADLSAAFEVDGAAMSTTAKLHPLPSAKVPRLTAATAQNGADPKWDAIAPLEVDSTLVWQGKVRDNADNSALVRLAHDETTLFIKVDVKDDVVVSNIASNDIKGHWRSDSIEICLDPRGGAENTMGCLKLGIFPFDQSGVVRGARDADARQGPIEETAPGTRLQSWHTPDGYRILASIPFAEIGFNPGSSRRLGFNLLVYDGDKRDAVAGENINKSRLAWAPRSGVMGRPEDWGRIDLE